MPKECRILLAMIVRKNFPTSPLNLFNAAKNKLASNFRHDWDNLNGPYQNDDYNEALRSIDDILRRQPPCIRIDDINHIKDLCRLFRR